MYNYLAHIPHCFFHCTLYYPHVFLQHSFNHYFILYYSFVYNSFISSFIIVTNGLLLTVCDMNPYIVHLCISINISREWFTWNLSKNKKNSKTLWCKQLKYASENSSYFLFYQQDYLLWFLTGYPSENLFVWFFCFLKPVNFLSWLLS